MSSIFSVLIYCTGSHNFLNVWDQLVQLFHDGDPHHIEPSPLICTANQWTGIYMTGTSVMKELTSQLI